MLSSLSLALTAHLVREHHHVYEQDKREDGDRRR